MLEGIPMNNITDFRDAQAARAALREGAAPRRITDNELSALRAGAEINLMERGLKADRDLVDALVELQDVRWEKKHG
jgi:hypothetical protein